MIYEDKIIETVVRECYDKKIIREKDAVIIAVSGGMDSMCLLDVFNRLSSDFVNDLVAVHINHGIRDVEAERDMSFVEEYCKSLGIKLIIENVDAVTYSEKNNLTLEEAARILRYQVFDKIWKEYSLKRYNTNTHILVAHHMQDQAETVIHNILRGTGIKGLAGMSVKNNYILRPLLNVSKSEIEEYVKKYAIKYVDDSTNNDLNYTRNYIRKELIGRFNHVNDKAVEHILSLSNVARDINDYLELLAKYVLKEMTSTNKNSEIVINAKLFNNTQNVLKTYIVKEIFAKLVNTAKDITKVHINDVIKLASKEKGGHIDLAYNVTLDKKQNSLVFKKNDKNISMSKRKKR